MRKYLFRLLIVFTVCMTSSYGQDTFFTGKGEVTDVEGGVKQVTTFYKEMRAVLKEFEDAQDELFGKGRSAKVIEIDSSVLIIERINLDVLKDRLQFLALKISFSDLSTDSSLDVQKFIVPLKEALALLKPKEWKEVSCTNTLSTVSEMMKVPNDPVYGSPIMEVKQDEKCFMHLKRITTNLISSPAGMPAVFADTCNGVKDCSPSQYVLAEALNRQFEMTIPTEYVSVALKVHQKEGKGLWEVSRTYFPLFDRGDGYTARTEVTPLMAHVVARNRIAALASTIA